MTTCEKIFGTKLIIIATLCLLSICFGCLPILMQRLFVFKKILINPTRNSLIDKTTKFLLSFGGGVLFFTSFIHLHPEVRATFENLDRRKIFENVIQSIGVQTSELLICFGFFLIYVLEELMHFFVGQPQNKNQFVLHRTMTVRRCSGKVESVRTRTRTQSQTPSNEECESVENNVHTNAGKNLNLNIDCDGHDDCVGNNDNLHVINCIDQNNQMIQTVSGCEIPLGADESASVSKEWPISSVSMYETTTTNHEFEEIPKFSQNDNFNDKTLIKESQTQIQNLTKLHHHHFCYSHQSHQHNHHHLHYPNDLNNDNEELEANAINLESVPNDENYINDNSGSSLIGVMRSLIAIFALSIHSMFEGLALGLEENPATLWYLFLAISTHKLVITFCVGIELVVSKLQAITVFIYVIAFSSVTPFGILIGTFVCEDKSIATTNILNNSESTKDESSLLIFSAFLQAIAAGTLLYVIFFEIIIREREEHNRGFIQIIAIICGFLFMLIMHSFVSGHEHSHDHGHIHSDEDGHAHGAEHTHNDDHAKTGGHLSSETLEKQLQLLREAAEGLTKQLQQRKLTQK